MNAKSQILIYTFHKCASMFIYRLGVELCRHLQINHFSTNNPDQRESITGLSWARFIERTSGPACFGPIRIGSSAPNLPDDLRPYVVIGHVRDPRDVLTSAFYSFAYHHPDIDPHLMEKWRAEGVDVYVLDHAQETLARYQELLAAQTRFPHLRIVKYETLVTDYPEWLAEVFAALEDFSPPPKTALHFFKRQVNMTRVRHHLERKFAGEFKVSGEDLNRHKRQVTPGDHQRKLAPETIKTVNVTLNPVLKAFGYSA